MAKTIHTCNGCVPIDRSVVEAYMALVNTTAYADNQEDARQQAEGQGDYSDHTTYPDTRQAKEAAREEAETTRKNNETERLKAEGQLGSSDPDYASSRIKKEIDRQEAETQRQANEGIGATDAECAAGSRRKNESIRQANEETREAHEATRQEQEGSPSDAASASGSRWARYKYAEANRESSFEAGEGESTDEASASGSRWARYNYAEASRETSYENDEGEATDTASATGSRWARYNKAEADRENAYDTAETTRNAGMAPLVGYFACETAASTAAKTVTASNYALANGGSIKVKFSHANTAASGVTLNINSTGAKDLYYNGAAVSATNTWEDNDVLEVYYDYANEIYQAASRATKEDVSQLGQEVEHSVKQDGGTDTDDELSFVDEDDNCIAQFKGGHIKTKEFDSRDAATETDLQNGLDALAETTVKVDNEDEKGAALAFVDENDECILQAKDGHIKTKNFDSRAAVIPDNVDEDDAAFAIVDDNYNGIVQFKDGHIKTKYFDSRDLQTKSTKFAGIGMDSLEILGTSSKTGDIISVSSGVANRVQIPADLQSWYYKILCTVKCTSGTAGITIGKNGYYGTLFTVSGSSLVVKLNGNDQEAVSIGFSLELNRVYTVTVSHNVSTSKVDTFEIYDDFGNYFSYTTPYTAHSYGNPVVYSETAAMQMTKFAMSMQERYNPNLTKMIVTGHSYVEADSLGADRESCFVSLLDNYNGDNSVVNCGLGGDTVAAMNNKMPYFIKMCPNTEYILMCVGGNDRTATADQIIERLETSLSVVINSNKTPVLFTINPASAGYENEAFTTVNSWIRQSGFHYVDMDKVFYSADGTINQSLYLQDGLHPTIEGHLRIFRRIQMDCPFLF